MDVYDSSELDSGLHCTGHYPSVRVVEYESQTQSIWGVREGWRVEGQRAGTITS